MSQVIRPVPYSPPPPPGSSIFARLKPATLAILVALALLAVLAAYVFTAKAVQIEITPEPNAYAVSGGLLNLKLGARHLLRSGDYTLRAEKPGYRPLQTDFEVGASSSQLLQFEMQKLPGLVSVTSLPLSGATVSVDGEAVGVTPLENFELAPGDYRLLVTKDRFRDWSSELAVAGALQEQSVEARLEPAWAEIEINSEPAGAEIRVDGEVLASTPASVEILEGDRQLEVSSPGFKTVERGLRVVAGESQTLPVFELQKSDGRVALDSRPRGASVTVGGVYRGQTPLSLALPPGREYQVQFSRAGYRKVARRIAVRSGEGRSLSVDLEPEQGTIKVTVNPASARVLVDGKPVGSGDQTLRLPAVPHKVRVELDGYAPYNGEVTPRPGFEQNLEVSLRTREQARYDALAATVETGGGQTLRLIRPGPLRMGASRREPGRRANEVIRAVLLTRPFYMATTEVSNEQYKRFEPRHESGVVGRTTLNLDKAPVVNISWEQAARYCNWLSARDGLPLAYREVGGQLVLARPVGTGYRLPSEAEWVWAARGDSRSKYPWGETMPPTAKAGNFADDSALPVVARVIAGFNDGFTGTAAVGSFPANHNGLHDFAGNVAEWVNDFYAVNPSPGGGAESDPLGPVEGDFHVVRGSSWKHSTITELRWSFRDYSAQPRNDIGFRIARYAD